MTNRLASETSPYLLQHKDNPVDWWPWGPEALDRAKQEDKPILLSIGYAACHWCHVMERESFEDPETASVMNEHFVPIKVDREERPDLDAVYMEAVQTMTGHGGWPMTVFLTPVGVPFYGGTYFPPEDRYGMPSFKRLLLAIADTWRERKQEATEQGAKLLAHLGGLSQLAASNDPISSGILTDALRGLDRSFDQTWGGFGSAPKFPQPMTIDFLLRMDHRGQTDAGKMAARTLDAMAAGGIFDQLGGGFARYSVDREWVVPHFEKMLYDNAQLIRTYARAWQQFGTDRYREVVESTVSWMLAEMRDAGGGLWSSLDADSEGEEGRYYVWTMEEFAEVAGEEAEEAIAHWGISEQGNFEGKNIPVYARTPDDLAAIDRARSRLLARRAERVLPGTDTKVLTAWNALAASCLAEAGWIMSRPDWIGTATEIMEFVLSTLRVDGRLMRSYREVDGRGDVRHLAYCEDYAFTLEACLALYETTAVGPWLDEATWAAQEAIRLFHDPERGGFFTTGDDAERLVTRSKDLIDNAVPAANSVLALELQRLSLITGDNTFESKGLEVLRMLRDAMTSSPGGFGHVLGAVDLYAGDPLEIVIVGKPDGSDTKDLLEVVRSIYLPNRVLVSGSGDGDSALPLLKDRPMREGRATAYVCRRGVCKAPVTEPDELRRELAA